MNWPRALREVRTMRFEEVYGRFRGGRLSCAEAADILGMSERNFLRYRTRYEVDGAEGLYDRRVGRVSGRRIAVDEATRLIELYATKYFDFNVKHFHEKLVTEHGLKFSYSWTKRVLQGAGQVKPAKKRGAHRRKRPRKALPGVMLHQDGSRHHWVPEVEWDLIVTMDGATSGIYSAFFFVEQEGTTSRFQALLELINGHGLFGSFYADRGSHYWMTKGVGAGIDKRNPTQVKRAFDQLGSSSFHPQHRKHEGVPSACSGRSRDACCRSCARPQSQPWRLMIEARPVRSAAAAQIGQHSKAAMARKTTRPMRGRLAPHVWNG